MKHSTIQILLLTGLFFISSISLLGQNLNPKLRTTEPDTTISSKIMGKDYQLYISFPAGYSNKDTIKYPVLYVLDGGKYFSIINGARKTMDIGKELEAVIIVCIGSGLDFATWCKNRIYDYTPTLSDSYDRRTEAELGFPNGSIRSGGAEKFLQCIITEIIPYINTHYKTTNDRGIAGHSLGGLFAAYCLLHSKDIFNRYGILSPSLWWNKEEVLNQVDSLISNNETWDIPATKIFISVGRNEGPLMVPGMTKLSTLLEDKAYKNVSLYWQVFEDETHLSVIPASFSKTVSVLYGVRP